MCTGDALDLLLYIMTFPPLGLAVAIVMYAYERNAIVRTYEREHQETISEQVERLRKLGVEVDLNALDVEKPSPERFLASAYQADVKFSSQMKPWVVAAAIILVLFALKACKLAEAIFLGGAVALPALGGGFIWMVYDLWRGLAYRLATIDARYTPIQWKLGSMIMNIMRERGITADQLLN